MMTYYILIFFAPLIILFNRLLKIHICMINAVAEGGDNVFVPQVNSDLIPKKGQTFDSIDEAFDFYNMYAKESGFSVRHHNIKRRKDTGEPTWKLFSCSKQGKTDLRYQKQAKYEKPRSGERNRVHTRTECEAVMSITKRKGVETWAVSHFIEKHNHPLTAPDKVHSLRSHRNLSETKRAPTERASDTNVPTPQQIPVKEVQSDDHSSTVFVERDARNAENDVKNELIRDTELFVQYMASEKKRNEKFYFAYDTNRDGVFVRCFWADSESRSNYAFFGDCIVFDATCNANKYSMILTLFVGVNHHRQAILLGCGLLSDEKIESLEWLFSTFLQAMQTHQAPNVIITNQDQAIGAAVKNIFPATFHRLCSWHITYKFPEKLGPVLFDAHKGILMNVIHQSESKEEFESKWWALMNSTTLGSNDWLRHMYELRERWVPSYVKGMFSASMSSSQRLEAHRAFVKRYVNKDDSLMDFITRFIGAITHQRYEELAATHIDLSQSPCLITQFIIEEQMAKVYTKANFLLFQAELAQSVSYKIRKQYSIEGSKTYEVRHAKPGEDHGRSQTVVYYPHSDIITCSCMLWPSEGIPCRHMLRLMDKKDVSELPGYYILRRWTKDAKSPVFEREPSFDDGMPVATRRGVMKAESNELFDDAALTQTSTNYVIEEMRNMKIRVKELIAAEGITHSTINGKDKIQDGRTPIEEKL